MENSLKSACKHQAEHQIPCSNCLQSENSQADIIDYHGTRDRFRMAASTALTRSMNFIGPQTKQRIEEVFRNTSMISLYCAIAWRKGSILLRFWAVLLFLCFSWRSFIAFLRSARVVMANLASSSGLRRFLQDLLETILDGRHSWKEIAPAMCADLTQMDVWHALQH